MVSPNEMNQSRKRETEAGRKRRESNKEGEIDLIQSLQGGSHQHSRGPRGSTPQSATPAGLGEAITAPHSPSTAGRSTCPSEQLHIYGNKCVGRGAEEGLMDKDAGGRALGSWVCAMR